MNFKWGTNSKLWLLFIMIMATLNFFQDLGNQFDYYDEVRYSKYILRPTVWLIISSPRFHYSYCLAALPWESINNRSDRGYMVWIFRPDILRNLSYLVPVFYRSPPADANRGTRAKRGVPSSTCDVNKKLHDSQKATCQNLRWLIKFQSKQVGLKTFL